MAQAGHLVEVKLLARGISLYGHVAQSRAQNLSVSLLTLPRLPELVAAGTEAEIVSVADGAIHAATATIAGLRGDALYLSLQQAPSLVQRRTAPRLPMVVPVQYRAIRADGRTGAWLDATSFDISIGGVGVLFDNRAEIPKRLELMFFPGTVNAGKGIARMYADDGSVILSSAEEDRPIRAVCRSAHCRTDPDGRIRVGISFTVMSSSDRQRLERILRSLSQSVAA